MSDSKVEFDPSISQIQGWAALAIGAGLLAMSARRRRVARLCLAAAGGAGPVSRPVGPMAEADQLQRRHQGRACRSAWHTRTRRGQARASDRRGVQLLASSRQSSAFHVALDTVHDHGNGRSHWVARGPGGLKVAWEAETINEVENTLIAWRSLPGSDIKVTAGSVRFDRVRGGRSTQVTVTLQYEPPAGRAGDFVARLFGRSASQMIRDDLRRLKQVLRSRRRDSCDGRGSRRGDSARMKAVRYYGKEDIRVESVPDPTIWIRAMRSSRSPQPPSVDRTSTSTVASFTTMEEGDILGHEFMGEVVDVGRDNTRLHVGDRVVVPFTIACGQCFSEETTLVALRQLEPQCVAGREAERLFRVRLVRLLAHVRRLPGRPSPVRARALCRRRPDQGARRLVGRTGALSLGHLSDRLHGSRELQHPPR